MNRFPEIDGDQRQFSLRQLLAVAVMAAGLLIICGDMHRRNGRIAFMHEARNDTEAGRRINRNNDIYMIEFLFLCVATPTFVLWLLRKTPPTWWRCRQPD